MARREERFATNVAERFFILKAFGAIQIIY